MRIDELQDALASAADDDAPGVPDPVATVRRRVIATRRRRRGTAGGVVLLAVSLISVVVIRVRDEDTVQRVVAKGETPTTARNTPGVSQAQDNIDLVPGSYGFLVPYGWNVTPLTNYGGPASFAAWTDPSGTSRVDYEASGGEFGVIYRRDGTPNPDEWPSLARCPVVSHTFVAPDRITYRCADVDGDIVQGVLVVHLDPKAGFWRSLQVRMPAARADVAAAILASFI